MRTVLQLKTNFKSLKKEKRKQNENTGLSRTYEARVLVLIDNYAKNGGPEED